MYLQPPPDSVRIIQQPDTLTQRPSVQPVSPADTHAKAHKAEHIDSSKSTPINAPAVHAAVDVSPAASHQAATPAQPAGIAQVKLTAAVVHDTVSDTVVLQPNPFLLSLQAPSSTDAGYSMHALDLGEYYCYFFPCATGANAEVRDTAVSDTASSQLGGVYWRESMFLDHSLQPSGSQYNQRASVQPEGWIFGVLVAITFFVCMFFRGHRLTIPHLAVSLFSRSEMVRLIREYNFNSVFRLVPALLLSTACVALFAYIYVEAFSIDMRVHSMALFLLFFLAVTGVVVLRNLFSRWLAKAFDCVDEVCDYLTSNYFFHALEAVLFLPLLFAVVYIPSLSITHYIIFAALPLLLYAVRIVRGLQLLLTNPQSSHFFLFYYLCTLEFIPIIILVKLIIS